MIIIVFACERFNSNVFSNNTLILISALVTCLKLCLFNTPLK